MLRSFNGIRPAPRQLAALVAGLLVALTSAPALGQMGEARLDTRWAFDRDAAPAGGMIHGALEVKVHGKFHVQSNQPLDEFLIPTVLEVTGPDGVTVREFVYPEPEMLSVPYSEQPLAVFEQEFVVGVALEVADAVAPGAYPLDITLNYQACDDRICLAPTSRQLRATLRVVAAGETTTESGDAAFEGLVFTGAAAPPPDQPDVTPPTPVTTPTIDCDVMAELDGFTILGTTGGYLSTDEFIAFIDAAETGTAQEGFFEGKGPIVILLIVLLGGLALNLTPCVLPLVPINLAIIGAGAQAGSRARGFALGGTYGLAMAAVYGVLGLVVTLTAATFGAINSTIWFNVAIAILFVLLGLAMFDLIYIDFTKYQAKLNVTEHAKKGTFALAFFMGGVSALLAGACVAPVVIQVIVYAGDQYAKGVTSALALPFFLGVGMALPWPFAGAGLSLLPKPGKWMNRVKQAMGVFILAFAAYYGYIAWGIYDSTRVDRQAVASAVADSLEKGWTASVCQGLTTARAENKPVLIDMWATWCKNCLAMDKTTFKDPQVEARLDDYVKIKFQAEDLSASPAREMIERFEGIGLPTYAILRPNAAE